MEQNDHNQPKSNNQMLFQLSNHKSTPSIGMEESKGSGVGGLSRRQTYQPNTNTNQLSSANKPPLQFKSQKQRNVASAQGVSAFGANSKENKAAFAKQRSYVLPPSDAVE